MATYNNMLLFILYNIIMHKEFIHPQNSLWTAKSYDWPWYFYKVYETVLDRQRTIIEHITPDWLKMMWFVELPTTDTGNEKDWIDEAIIDFHKEIQEPIRIWYMEKYRKSIKKFMPKPVEPVLIPLDIEKVSKHLFDCVREYVEDFGRKKNDIIDIFADSLSKYWVPTQQAPVTSTIEELADKIYKSMPNISENYSLQTFTKNILPISTP